MVSVVKRDESIDVLRGVAMLLVIMGHYMEGTVKVAIFSFHIPLFLFISGWLYKKEKANYKRQFKRLLLPYFACVFTMQCIDFINGLDFQRLFSGLLCYSNEHMAK